MIKKVNTTKINQVKSMVTYFHDRKLHNAIMLSILTTIISWCYFFLPIIFCIYLFLSSVFDWSSVLLLSFSKVFAFKKCLELKEKIQYSVHFLILWTFLWGLNIKLEIFFAKVVLFFKKYNYVFQGSSFFLMSAIFLVKRPSSR